MFSSIENGFYGNETSLPREPSKGVPTGTFCKAKNLRLLLEKCVSYICATFGLYKDIENLN